MKKTILILIITIFMMFSKSTFANESVDRAEVVFRAMHNNMYKKGMRTLETVNYSVEIIKKWPESIYASECINALLYSFDYGMAAPWVSEDVTKNNVKWFENHIINNNTSDVEISELIVFACMLSKPKFYFDHKRSDYYPDIYKVIKDVIYKNDSIENESIKILKYIENHSKNKNYRNLAFLALLSNYYDKENNIDHIKKIINQNPKHPHFATIRFYYANRLLNEKKYEEGYNEIKKIIEFNKDAIVPLENYNYGVKCYDKLACLYFQNKDYLNAKKYIMLLKKNAPADFPRLKALEKTLNSIEKLIKK